MYDKNKNNFGKCQAYTGQLMGALVDVGVDESKVPAAPDYETKSLIEVAPK